MTRECGTQCPRHSRSFRETTFIFAAMFLVLHGCAQTPRDPKPQDTLSDDAMQRMMSLSFEMTKRMFEQGEERFAIELLLTNASLLHMRDHQTWPAGAENLSPYLSDRFPFESVQFEEDRKLLLVTWKTKTLNGKFTVTPDRPALRSMESPFIDIPERK